MKKCILLLAALSITAMMLSAQNKTALVIGNGNYKNNFAALSNPVPEARRMAAALENIGFKVIRAYNVQNQERFDALFAMFEKEIRARGGITLFHYGGHGVQVDGQNYLLPTERDIPDERRARTRGINVADVVSAMESARADANIVILGACRTYASRLDFYPFLFRSKPPACSFRAAFVRFRRPPWRLFFAIAQRSLREASLRLASPLPRCQNAHVAQLRSAFGALYQKKIIKNRLEVLKSDRLLDACRENPFGRGAARGLARVDAPPNSIVVYAADAGETAQDGLFTPTLLKYLTRPGMSLTDIPMNTRRDVRQASGNRQRPGEYSMLETDIYLAGASGAASARPNAPSFSLEQSYGGKNESKTITVQENHSLAVAFNWVERPDVPDGYVLVEGGTFRMGSPSSEDGRDDDEGPQHSVTVGSFYMKATEVTQKEWREVMGSNPSYFKGDDRPVESVSWFDAVKYCNALSKKEGRTPVYRINGESVTANWSADGYRLPTEAEWEYAARGGTTTAIYTGSLTIRGLNNAPALDAISWYGGNSGYKYPYSEGYDSSGWSEKQYNHNKAGTRKVGQKRPNPYGLYDMLGNVWEWCWDWYGDYSSGSQIDPGGPSSGAYRVSRGGSWDYYGRLLRSANRGSYSPGNSTDRLGFRPVRRR